MMVDTLTVDEALANVQQRMRDAAASGVPLVQQAARHIIDAGGKRLRPRLLFHAYGAAGGLRLEEALPLGVAIELIHTATLVHDDINDHSALRRGRVTVNAKWGRTIALLTGDFLFTRAYSLMAPQGDRFNQLLASACSALVEGEVLQAVVAKSGQYDRDNYVRIISLKTAALFSCAARLGGLKAGAPEEHVEALGTYGHNLGLAFQIVDDVLDITGDPGVTGKPAHEDAGQHKLGLVALARENGGTARGTNLRDTDILTEPLLAAGLVDEAMGKARELTERGCAALQTLPDSPARRALEGMARKVVSRDR
jgi:geranylgeranyl pyrophosphate synthase